jgi:hypothetical protein
LAGFTAGRSSSNSDAISLAPAKYHLGHSNTNLHLGLDATATGISISSAAKKEIEVVQ